MIDAPPSYDVEILIDPGAAGGILAHENGTTVAWSMPANLDLTRDILETYKGRRVRVHLEKVGGVNAAKGHQTGSSMFAFGKGVGELIGLVTAMHYDLVEVTPQKWQKPLQMKRSGDSNTVWKNKLKDIALASYPNHKITLKTADAFLMLRWLKPESVEVARWVEPAPLAPPRKRGAAGKEK